MIKESEARYRELFDNASDCIYTIDLEGNFLTANNSVAKAMKCSSLEEVLASNMSKWMTTESLEKAIKFMHEVITTEDYYDKSVIIEIIRKDGEHVCFEHKARPIKDNNNNIIGLHGIGRDITENVLLKRELNKSNKQRKLLYYLIKGTRGGKSRTLILKHLMDRPYNANQLANAMKMDYKTVRHHLDVLIKNGIITMNIERNRGLYFISKSIESNLNYFNNI